MILNSENLHRKNVQVCVFAKTIVHLRGRGRGRDRVHPEIEGELKSRSLSELGKILTCE